MELTSPAFKQGERIPKKFTADAEDVSPALRWSGAPDATRSFALIMDDPDAPPGTWVHWLLYDLPPVKRELPEGVQKSESGPDGAKHGLVWGVDRFERVGYFGPEPPPGAPHRYFFKLYALDVPTLGLPAKATKAQLLEAMDGHVLGEAELMGVYQR